MLGAVAVHPVPAVEVRPDAVVGGVLADVDSQLAVAVALQRQQDTGSDLDAGLIPVTVPELLRLLCDILIPPPRPGETGPTGCTGQPGDDGTSTAPARPINAEIPMPRQHQDHNELQLP